MQAMNGCFVPGKFIGAGLRKGTDLSAHGSRLSSGRGVCSRNKYRRRLVGSRGIVVGRQTVGLELL